jgi:hypothetical protein
MTMGNRSADGAAVAHLRISDHRGDFRQPGTGGSQKLAGGQIMVPRHRAYADVPILRLDQPELISQRPQVDHSRRPGETKLQQRDERMSPGQDR